MRPIAIEQDTLRFPLNDLLGTKAQVRLLRVLADEIVGPITVADAADRSGLTEAGARRALGRLAKTGFVRRVGGGRSRQFELRTDDLVARQLVPLFRGESDRYQRLLASIRNTLESLTEIRVAWLDAPPARPGEPLHIGVVGESGSLAWLSDEIRSRIAEVERDFDLTIEVHSFSRADAPNIDWAKMTLLAGVPSVEALASSRPPPGHGDRDRRALRLAEAVSDLLDRDPSLVRRAIRHLELVLEKDQGAAAHDLREWHSILSQYSIERLREFLVSTTSRAQRLRQSSPFLAALAADERDEVLLYLEIQNDPRST